MTSTLSRYFGRYSQKVITSLVQKFECTYSLCDVTVPVRRRFGRSAENIARIDVSVPNDPNQPISRHSQELCIVQATLWRFLRKDLGLHIYKIKLTQELKPMGHTAHDTIGLLRSKFGKRWPHTPVSVG